MTSDALCLIQPETNKREDVLRYLESIGAETTRVCSHYTVLAKIRKESPEKLKETIKKDIEEKGKNKGIRSLSVLYVVEGFTKYENGEIREINSIQGN